MPYLWHQIDAVNNVFPLFQKLIFHNNHPPIISITLTDCIPGHKKGATSPEQFVRNNNNLFKYLSHEIILQNNNGINGVSHLDSSGIGIPFAENFSKVIDVRSRAAADTKKNQPSTIVNVTNSGDTVTVSYAINNVQMDYVSGTDLARISVSKFFRNTDPSLPETSSRTDSFEVPEGYTVDIELTKAEYSEFNTCIPYASKRKTDNHIPTILDNVVTKATTKGFYPTSALEQNNITLFRGHVIQNVTVNPIQFNYETST